MYNLVYILISDTNKLNSMKLKREDSRLKLYCFSDAYIKIKKKSIIE